MEHHHGEGSILNNIIHPRTDIGAVRLRVSDLIGMQTFYREAIGLSPLPSQSEVVRLGAGGRPLVELIHAPDAGPRPGGTTGLFHLAILFPDRRELALAIKRALSANWGFTGASDHRVSEALYLDDPEGNGIELYRDRPKNEWRLDDEQIHMTSLPLDVEDLLSMAPDPVGTAAPDATTMGHVHLNVRDIDEAEDFYCGLLGFEVTVRGYPGALFVSAGGYHHHLGLNTWFGQGAPPAPKDSRGLERYEILVPDAGELRRITSRLNGAASDYKFEAEELLTADPSGNRILLRTSP